MRSKYSCKFPNCKNTYYTRHSSGSFKNKHFYKFPKKSRMNLLRKWKEICNIKDEVFCDNFYVCEDHFLPKDFVNETRHRINYSVVPKVIVHVDQEEGGILSDHSYFKFENESGPTSNLANDRGSHVDLKTEDLNLNSNDTYESSNGHTTNDTTSGNTPTLSPKPDRLNVEDELFCSTFAQFETDNLEFDDCSASGKLFKNNIEDIESVTNIVKNVDAGLLFIDSRYEFLLSPIDSEDIVANEDNETSDAGLQKLDLALSISQMHKIHTNITIKLEKLKKILYYEKDHMKILLTLYEKGTFKVIHKYLGHITNSFIDSQVRSANAHPNTRSWSTQDKTIALFLYKHGSRLYKYLLMYFELPSIRLLKSLFSRIPLDTGLDPLTLAVLKSEVSRMNPLDKYCSLVFDKMPLDQGFYYEANKQKICGYEDLGHLGRSHVMAKHALVFMVRGLKKSWKQVVAYYFIGPTISSECLKTLIVEIISQLQNVGLNVVATICDHTPLYWTTLKVLCTECLEESKPFCFFVNSKPVVTIFRAPHLLKTTQNVFIDHNIELDGSSLAKFEYIEKLFILDTKKKFKSLPKLNMEHFASKDINFKVAAAQLSNTVATGIETLVITNLLPPDAIYTAEFASVMDNLFDSLNGYDLNSSNEKQYRCALTDKSPHMDFWSEVLNQLGNWKVINLQSGKDETDSFSFIEGWQLTIGAMIFLWEELKKVGFTHLNLRAFSEQPLEHLFYCIRQYSKKTNPTCSQFIDSLKTCIVNNYLLPFENPTNYQNNALPLFNATHFWIENMEDININHAASGGECIMPFSPEHLHKYIDAQYIIEYILNSIDFDEMCYACKNDLFSSQITGNYSTSSISEGGDTSYLVSQTFVVYLNTITDKLYKCLERYNYMDLLEERFKNAFRQKNTTKFCNEHAIEISILNKAVPLLIYKYVTENNKTLQIIYERHGKSLQK